MSFSTAGRSGKPADEAEAREYLDRMSGRAHEVLSGLVVLADGEERSGLERTTVVFKELNEAEKERYVAFGEWRGRSGGYAIQTLGSTLVERIEGSVSNVVGLPVGLLFELAPELFERLTPGREEGAARGDWSAAQGERLVEVLQQDVRDLRVEVGAAALLDDLHRLVHRHRRPIGAVAEQGVEDVGDGDDPALHGNVLAAQPRG